MSHDRPWTARALLAVGAAGLTLVACGGGASTVSVASGVRPTAAPSSVPGGDWPTFDYNAQRSGVGPDVTGIGPGDLHLLRRRSVHFRGGVVDSSPIELHAVSVAGRVRDVVVVSTDYGRTIAIDPGTGAKLWQFVPPGSARLIGSSQIMTSTPIADPGRRYVYAGSPTGIVYKLSLASGHAVWATRVTFDATREKLEGAFNIEGSNLLVATGGYYGDPPSYQGHLAALDLSSGRVVAVFNALCSNRHSLIDPPRSCPASDAAIWGRPGSVIEPSGRILVATGNGPFNGSTNWGDSVLELSAGLALLHNYTPPNQAHLNSSDTDLGSSEPALLGTVGGRALAVQGGKDGILRLLDLGALDGTTGPAAPRTGGDIQQLPLPGSAELFSQPAVWSDDGHVNVFVADSNGTADYVLGGNGRLHVAWHNGTGGTSPIVAGGLLYVYNPSGGVAVYAPASGSLLATLPTDSGHWNSPIVVGGRVIVPEGDDNSHGRSGTIEIFHLPGH